MCSQVEIKEIIDVTMKNVSTNQQQIVISLRPDKSCNEEQVEDNYRNIIGKILNGRNVIIVTKEDKLRNLISDDVDSFDRNYVINNAIEVVSFTPRPESNVKHHATLVNELPISVAKDLANSAEFVYGNLWFLIPHDDIDISLCGEDIINDIRKLTPSTFSEMPVLQYEAIASPAMYDGLEILWFNPNESIISEHFAPMSKQ